MWPFNKKIIFSSQYWDLNIVKESFEKSPKNFPSYMKSMPPYKFCPFIKIFKPAEKTIKSCSGFVNLFKRSILFKMPCDLHVIFSEEGILETYAGASINVNQQSFASLHHNNQFINYIKSDYKFIIKISPQIFIESNTSTLMQPSFFHLNPFEIIPGILNKNYTGDFNFFVPIKKDQKDLLIKKNTPLFLLTPLTEKKVGLSFSNSNTDHKNTPYFSSLKKHVMERI